MIEGIAFPVADAFLQVTVFVAVMVGLFAYLQHRLGDRLTRFLLKHWRAGPVLGALVGVIPGCGGAILVVPLFVRSRVSFGTLVAALVATMGDASFVIIAADPALALRLHVTLAVTGLVTGYVVDAVGYSPRPRPSHELACDCLTQARAGAELVSGCVPDGRRGTALVLRCGAAGGARPPVATSGRPVLGVEGARLAGLARRVAAVARDLGPVVVAFWGFVAVGVSVATPVLAQVWEPGELPRLVTGVDPFLSVGGGGTLLAFLVAHRARRERRGEVAPPVLSGAAAVLREAAQEAARITVWIAVAFVAIEVTTELGFALTGALSLVGLVGVVVGAALGLIPGCAPQIVLTGLYASGALPFATLLANALSQDGDALLPLLLMDRRSAVIASVITTVPGLVLGTLVLVLGITP